MRRTWFDEALGAIDAARETGEALGLSGAELLAHINAHGHLAWYPGTWPYRQWLKARRYRCGDLPGVRPLPQPGRSTGPAPMPGQLTLEFEPLRREDRRPLPDCFGRWSWYCRTCGKYRPRDKPQRCRKCKQPSERYVTLASDPYNPQPYDLALQRYRDRMAEDRRRWELLRAEKPELPPYDDIP